MTTIHGATPSRNGTDPNTPPTTDRSERQRLMDTRREAIRTAALAYHDRGLWVVICDREDRKSPTLNAWGTVRRERDELNNDLAADYPLDDPLRNIGIVLSQSDFIDIECDSAKGEVELQALFNCEIPKTPTFRSRCGLHRLFLRPLICRRRRS